uniref:Essential protein Yae1 N-terminal domain-containing protein n=1 Tax=Peronospora matthiolae TaxID=2874970 RepID=A0AAV1TZX8_9STRA
MDITDVFDAISGYEETLVAQGEAMGIERGRELGIEEGRELGLLKGAEIGSELGFYQGCYMVWNHMLQQETLRRKLPDRAAKSVVTFGALLKAFKLKNVVDEDIMQELFRIRAKFKVITATTGLRRTLVYNKEDIDAHKNMSF